MDPGLHWSSCSLWQSFPSRTHYVFAPLASACSCWSSQTHSDFASVPASPAMTLA
jgi:hypothetical protein